ncbi:MAG: hypothetical protein WDO56_11780 [Gammaproteobacteria bacterium]
MSLVTAHGRQVLKAERGECIADLLHRYHIPWSAVSIYLAKEPGGEGVQSACLDRVVSEMRDAAEVLLYFNRNVNPFLFSLQNFTSLESEDPANKATEYFYQKLESAGSAAETYLKVMSPEECRRVIAERVGETICTHLPRGSRLVIGVSGGGDSNALLHGLSQIRDHDLSLHPVIIKGIPDWDLGVPRAQQLCEQYGLSLTVIEEDEVKSLLGMRDPVSLVDRFEREFKGDDFEFLGTLLIRLALFRHARSLGTGYVCTGLNLEDVLCEALFRISSGMKPAGMPNRAIGDMNLLMPLWMCPKRIIDGCFPKLSRQNYDARYPCFSLGRNLYYSVIYSLQSEYPGFIEQLARGISQLAATNPVTYVMDEQLGFHVERFIPFPLRQRFKRMLGEAVTAD